MPNFMKRGSMFVVIAALCACADRPSAPISPVEVGPRSYIDPSNLKTPPEIRAFFQTAVLSKGRALSLAGPIQCTPARVPMQFKAVVTQASTGAEAFAVFNIICTEQLETWNAVARVTGRNSLEPGSAIACAAWTAAFLQPVGGASWCRTITIVDES